MNIAKSYEFFQPESLHDRIHIIGCGAVGATVAEQLVRFGIEKITLWDFDTVEPHNIANQIYTDEDIGKKKVNALADYLIKINPDILLSKALKIKDEPYVNQRLSGVVVLAVDNIDLRRQIAENNVGNMNISAMFDFRMRLTDAQHYAADWKNPDSVKKFIQSMNFTSEEAQAETPVSACNLPLSVVPTVRLICSLGVANMINFFKGEGLKKMIVSDAFEFYVEAF